MPPGCGRPPGCVWEGLQVGSGEGEGEEAVRVPFGFFGTKPALANFSQEEHLQEGDGCK